MRERLSNSACQTSISEFIVHDQIKRFFIIFGDVILLRCVVIAENKNIKLLFALLHSENKSDMIEAKRERFRETFRDKFGRNMRLFYIKRKGDSHNTSR